ncbi:MarR family winged helix-turn-helix transcriptional regulator [Paenibacillus glycanilyticus]|uniref:MarR family winged helix-turn-helix transcriptional regulator n=1 Tax=Paenibacillus glycanilyticus TaxID=126569 RepID=UPI00203BB532|nr:MarR family winged helix-turn-helix transcriptional regulator [Paenibacillus glycanilyticus]MCM3628303.1 MarR family winged helix-turn-helix transcriptional regulator [Paenibacillus glycanilyticus]
MAIDINIPAVCNCTKLRRAQRHITRLYDTCLAESGAGLRATQFSILGYLKTEGPKTMMELAELMTMDRATIGHNLRPLERDSLVRIAVSETDRRARIVSITDEGLSRLEIGKPGWAKAQAEFERQFGAENAKLMRDMMDDVAGISFSFH